MKTSKILWGLLALGAAVLLLMMAFGGIGAEYSPFRILGSVLLLGIAIASIIKLEFFMFFIPLSVLVILWKDTDLWAKTLGFPVPDVWLLLGSAVLLSIGFSVFFHKQHSAICAVSTSGDWKTEEVVNDNENVSINAGWGEHIKYVHADNLKKARIKTSFASTKVYFNECTASPDGLQIDIDASFCELVLNVPGSWVIDNRTNVFAADVNEHVVKKAATVATVTLTGNVRFGELKIVYV